MALAAQRGFFTRADARESGVGDREIAACVRTGAWLRFRHGDYSLPDVWRDLSPEQRHLVRCRAVIHSMGDAVCLSHVSAVVAHGIPVWGVDLSRVHVTRRDAGAPRIDGDVVHHVARLPDIDVMQIGGMLATAPDRALIEAGSQATSESALVSFDAALHGGMVAPDQLVGRFEQMRHWPGTRRLHVPLRLADGHRESPGESRGYWMFWRGGIPTPVCQFEVRENGVLIGVTDFAWPDYERFGEFDGALKYTRLLRPGENAADVVLREKRREDELRRVTGYGMMRFIWADYDRPGESCQRVRRFLGIRAS